MSKMNMDNMRCCGNCIYGRQEVKDVSMYCDVHRSYVRGCTVCNFWKFDGFDYDQDRVFEVPA